MLVTRIIIIRRKNDKNNKNKIDKLKNMKNNKTNNNNKTIDCQGTNLPIDFQPLYFVINIYLV